jgi:Tol biopolymer transport system component
VLSGDAQGSGFGFYRLALDTGNTELVAHIPRNVSSYDLSPDGRTIFYAFEKVDNLPTGLLMRLDVESHRETELRNDLWCVSLAVSPDGMHLATALGGGAVEVMPAAGGQSRELFRPADSEVATGALRQALAWTPDQRFLLFVRADGALWKAPALGGKAEKVGISMRGVKSPTVHPDGKRIVFSGVGEFTRKFWVLENFLPAPNARR